MSHLLKRRSTWINLVLILANILVLVFNVQAQEPVNPEPVEIYEAGGTAPVPDSVEPAMNVQSPVPEVVKYKWTKEPPVLTAEQIAQLEYWQDHTNLRGPKITDLDALAMTSAPPPPGTEAVIASDPGGGKGPLAPGSYERFKKITYTVPGDNDRNTMEASNAQNGKYIFLTGNWFAARSTDFNTFTYVNPFDDMADFCCDQVTIFDESRNAFFWLRLGIPSEDEGGNYENRFRLGVSTNEGLSFCQLTYYPTDFDGSWTDQWWDYPHMQLGADYLYLTWNIRNEADDWTRHIIIRMPLDSLINCNAFVTNYWSTTSWHSFVPVQGSSHIMYFASNWPSESPYNRLYLVKWAENSVNLSFYSKTVTAWSWAEDFNCGDAATDWADEAQQRILTGARYMIYASNLSIPGRTILGWWWNVPQNGSFPYPYIEGAAFYEDTLAQVGGNQGRPFIWSSSTCFLYPSAVSNKRGDLAIIFNYGYGTAKKPAVGATIADDYSKAIPPLSSWYAIQYSNARPSDKRWGDYNTLREFEPTQKTWVGSAHFIAGSTNCEKCSTPVFFVFGRTRDKPSVTRWWNK